MTFNGEITIGSFCDRLGCSEDILSAGTKQKFSSINTRYKESTKQESEEYILRILMQMDLPFVRRSRDENLRVWEKGWEENLEEFQANPSESSLKPKYFRPSKFFRYNKNIIIPENSNIEYDLFGVIRLYLFERYFRDFDAIYELGCGSCQNVYALAKLFPEKIIHGLDWTRSSARIAESICINSSTKVRGTVFDLMNPSEDLQIDSNSIVFSIHSLEQLGTNYGNLISFLMKKMPRLVFHYEPITELFDESNIYDYLAREYCSRRNYLSGYLNTLRKLAEAGKIELLEEHRPGIGGIYHDSSFILWRPL